MQLARALQQMQPSYIREILAAASRDDVISLAGGLPDSTQFPLHLMADKLNSLAEQTELFQYGETAGYQPLLNYFKQSYQLPEHHAGLICTGSQQGLDLIARAFIDQGDKVVMEAPSYLGALQVFALAQADVISVEQDAEGPDLAQLEQTFKQNKVKLFYAVPDFHNPTGVCWSLATRQRVAELCQQYQVTLIEDVPYRELRFSGEALPLVSSFCPDNSIVLRSFSKIATPGIRLGLVTGLADWIRALIKVKQSADLHSSVPMQAVLLSLLEHDEFEQHLEQLKQIYRDRYLALAESLTKWLPDNCQCQAVEGGMFVWLSLPECDSYALANQALEHGVAVVPSSVFYRQGEPIKPALRLNFTNASSEELDTAVQRLAKVIKEFTA